jgi:hypothetical protein
MHLTVNGFRVWNILLCGFVYNFKQFNAHRKQTAVKCDTQFCYNSPMETVEEFLFVVIAAVGRCN